MKCANCLARKVARTKALAECGTPEHPLRIVRRRERAECGTHRARIPKRVVAQPLLSMNVRSSPISRSSSCITPLSPLAGFSEVSGSARRECTTPDERYAAYTASRPCRDCFAQLRGLLKLLPRLGAPPSSPAAQLCSTKTPKPVKSLEFCDSRAPNVLGMHKHARSIVAVIARRFRIRALNWRTFSLSRSSTARSSSPTAVPISSPSPKHGPNPIPPHTVASASTALTLVSTGLGLPHPAHTVFPSVQEP